MTAKSVSGPDKAAFLAGKQGCIDKWTQFHTVGLEEYRPTAGRETAYRAGWKLACDKIEGKAERKRGRRRGIQLIGSGVILESIGLGILYGSPVVTGGRVEIWYGSFLAFGVINIVIGIVAAITGVSDE